MSTTFRVYPGISSIPTFQELLDRSSLELHRYLASVGSDARPSIAVGLRANQHHEVLPLDLGSPLKWNRGNYAWFSVGDVLGGTDAYFCPHGEFSESDCRDLPRAGLHQRLIDRCVRVPHYWYFRRSMGQPAIINVAYGLIAASLAELTSGFLYSNDSAWDFERMPALPNEFMEWYFRPEHSISNNFRDWSTRCIAGLREELGG